MEVVSACKVAGLDLLIPSFCVVGIRGRGGPDSPSYQEVFRKSSSDGGMQSGRDSRRCVADPLALVAVCRLAHRGGWVSSRIYPRVMFSPFTFSSAIAMSPS